MTVDDPGFWFAVLQIIWIDLLLSGDNAVVIALACRTLPPRQRAWGIALGTLVAIGLRVVFTGVVTTLMAMPYVKLIGGLLLLWIAIKLLGGEEEDQSTEIEPVANLWHAVKIIAIADAVMSLDNVIAIAMAARGSYALLMFGLAVSIPLIMAGAALVIALLERFPIIVWAGGALLGWIAGEIIAKDPLITGAIDPAMTHTVWMVGAVSGAVFVLSAGLLRRRWLARSRADDGVELGADPSAEEPEAAPRQRNGQSTERAVRPVVIGDGVRKTNGSELPHPCCDHRSHADPAPLGPDPVRPEAIDHGKQK